MRMDSAMRYVLHFFLMYSNFQFCKKKLSKFKIKRVDSWYGYTEAFKTAHAR